MRYGIFSDVHANLEALETILSAFKKEQIDKYICLGDIVGYGADPDKCITLIKKLDSINIAGNHDWAVAGIMDYADFSPDAAYAVAWTQNKITKTDHLFLKKLELKYEDNNLSCVHSALVNSDKFPYIYNYADALTSFYKIRKNICFIGHTHIPRIFCFNAETILILDKMHFKINLDHLYLCNVGSVGQPRDYNPQAAYCIYDTKKKLVEIKRISYNITQAQYKIRKAKLPEFLAKRISQGR
ncbi:MAG: metallophosphoesterase family protein [Candidatus Omnitrophota bacterium]